MPPSSSATTPPPGRAYPFLLEEGFLELHTAVPTQLDSAKQILGGPDHAKKSRTSSCEDCAKSPSRVSSSPMAVFMGQ